MTLAEALIILQRTIRRELVHQDYRRVVDLAAWYKKIITGEGIETLLRRVVSRESEEMFEQRKRLTVAITPAVSEQLLNPFYRVGRLSNVKKNIYFDEKVPQADKRKEEITERLKTFWGKKPLDTYLSSRFIQLISTDPNAWLVVEFGEFDLRKEKAKPYPVEFSSEQAIDFKITNNETEYLIIKQTESRQIRTGTGTRERITEKQANIYTMYLPNDIIKYTQIFDEEITTATELKPFLADADLNSNWLEKTNVKYVLSTYQPKGGEVQAVRVGYKPDLQTNGRTFVNPFHAAAPYFEKSLKTVSEMDLTMAFHAFNQKVVRTQPCPGDNGQACLGGRLSSGLVCGTCKGTGTQTVHVSTQEVIEVPPPRKGEDPIPLDDIIKYFSPSVELIEFQNKYIQQLKEECITAVFSTDVLSKNTVVATATEKNNQKEEYYNAFHPFAEHYSEVYKKIVRLVAAFTDNAEGLEVLHEFPSNYKLETLTELLATREAAVKAGVPPHFLQQIDKDIAVKMFSDDELSLQKYLVKNSFVSMLGFSENTVLSLIADKKLTQEEELLYIHSNTIFDELEVENPAFFYMTPQKQWEQIKAKIKDISNRLPKETTVLPFRDQDEEGQPPKLELTA